MHISPVKGYPSIFYKNSLNAKNEIEQKKNIYNPDINNQPEQYPFINNYGIYNVSFSGNQMPIYTINSEGEYKRYNSYGDAVKDFDGTTYMSFANALYKNMCVRGHYIVRAKDVEVQDEEGNVSIDESKLMSKFYNLTKESAIYAIDKNGDYKRFTRLSKTAEKLGVAKSSISFCLQDGSNRVTANGYSFVRAKDVEYCNDEGELIVDKSKIDEIISKKNHVQAVYAIDEQGNYTRYASQKEAADCMGITPANLHSRIKSGIFVKGCIIARANEIEYINDKGELIVDKSKIDEIINSNGEGNSSRAVYAIDEQGNYTRYATQREAADCMDINHTTLNKHIKNGTRIKGYIIARASEIEYINDEGKLTIDLEKMSCFHNKTATNTD